jgi:hypothetical protein
VAASANRWQDGRVRFAIRRTPMARPFRSAGLVALALLLAACADGEGPATSPQPEAAPGTSTNITPGGMRGSPVAPGGQATTRMTRSGRPVLNPRPRGQAAPAPEPAPAAAAVVPAG